jgi:polyhydroxyalkanoate synthase
MKEKVYLEGRKMATTFNMLRPNDLIWPYVVSNYFMGKEPAPFDILYWNSDSTRLPAANHTYYLRNCYLENKLSRGHMVLGGVKLDLKKVKTPIYDLATREDHIAPADSVLLGRSSFGGPVEFVLAGSGHIAGVINPPSASKYQYWIGGDRKTDNVAVWLATAKEQAGSWWPHWQNWITKLDNERVPARSIGSKTVKPIEDAPGSYVKVKT